MSGKYFSDSAFPILTREGECVLEQLRAIKRKYPRPSKVYSVRWLDIAIMTVVITLLGIILVAIPPWVAN